MLNTLWILALCHRFCTCLAMPPYVLIFLQINNQCSSTCVGAALPNCATYTASGTGGADYAANLLTDTTTGTGGPCQLDNTITTVYCKACTSGTHLILNTNTINAQCIAAPAISVTSSDGKALRGLDWFMISCPPCDFMCNMPDMCMQRAVPQTQVS